ncbi:MAG: response regulator [Planctomyces sp.]|nr:response regulator [Planctomyces sp.]
MATDRIGVYRVILADDAGEFRDWLRSLLEGSSRFTVVGEAQTGSEAVKLAGSLMPDLVITDVDMPDGDGLEVVRILREQVPAVQVIVVSANTGKGYERMAREEGAAAFIPKAQLSLEALSQVLLGEGSQ